MKKKLITLEDALKLKANYVSPQELNIKDYQIISADMNTLVITNPSSLLPVAHTDGFSTCFALAVEDTKTGAIALTHLPEHVPEALEQMIVMMKRLKNPLKVHLLGGCWDVEGQADIVGKKEWDADMQRFIDVVNAHANVSLATFEIGNDKPHPCSVAFCRDAAGEMRLVRGSPDFSSTHEITYPTMPQQRELWHVDAEMPHPPPDFKPSAKNPFALVFDGRMPENQDESKQPKPGLRKGKKVDVPLSPR